MTFEHIIGHERQISFLRRVLANNRLAHAYLFEGPAGVGKRLVATALARAVFCAAGNGCGDCAACRKTDHNNHPDLHIVEPDGQFIKIDQVRELQRELSFRPVEAKRKVCLIDEAERMNPAAANALLKTLEEPSNDTLIILLSDRPEALLETVLSRCQRIPFGRIERKRIETLLLGQRELSPDQAHIISSLAAGSFQKALGCDHDFILNRRPDIIRAVTGLSSGSILPIFELAKTISAEKEAIPDTLEILVTFYRDLLLYRLGQPDEQLVNVDLAEKIRRLAAGETADTLIGKLQAISEGRRNLDRNVNAQLNLEVLLMRLAA